MGDLHPNPCRLGRVDLPTQPLSDLPRGATEDEHPSIPLIAEHVADPRRGPAAAALRPRDTLRVQDPREAFDPVPLRRQLEEPPHGGRPPGRPPPWPTAPPPPTVTPLH